MLRRLLILFALLFAPSLAQARGIDPQLVAEGPATPGGEVELAIVMHTRPGWHGYWLNPGDAGLPMQVDWTLPPGAAVGPLRYPVPGRLTIAGLMNYVYEDDYAVLTRLKVPADARGTIPIRAEARWLACTDKICVPESGTLSLDLPVGTGTPNRAQFDQWRKALPQPLASAARFEATSDRLRVAIPLPSEVAVEEPYLFAATEGVVDYAGEQSFRRAGDTLVAELPLARPARGRFAGVVALGDGRGLSFEAQPGDVPSGGRTIGDPGAEAIAWAVLGALVGGLLLNLMPCVFPILALKALHLARSGGEASDARRDALAYTAGAVIGTGALGVALLAIRAAGAEAGWAFQLQDPRTVMLLLLLAVAISANLLGLFELPVIGGRARPAGSFGSGALAAFVATPCAGPFLGVALGTALLLPAMGSIAVFAALGLGLAIPFLAVAFVPALRKRLPAPGPWMLRLQRVLAIPMMLTAFAALWLLWRQGGNPALLAGLAASLALALALAWAGWRQGSGNAAPAAAVAAFGIAIAAVMLVPEQVSIEHSVAGAEPWSETAVAKTLQSGRPAFVYFTADWCLTCKANEAAAIDRDSVRDAFNSAGVEIFAADWTNGDPEITRFLESRGRAGVPLYLWYAPGRAVEELPQILTPGMLIGRANASSRRRPGSQGD